MIKVSVVIPTFQREALLQRCLSALFNQTLAFEFYEILVIHDGPHPQFNAFRERCRQGDDRGVVRIYQTATRNGPAVARNTGWRLAQGAIIAFTDDDCIPARDWLERGLACFSDPVLAGISGRIVVPVSGSPTDYERCTSWLQQSPFATANTFYRKTALASCGGFDENFTAAWREDSDLYFTLLEQGYVLASADDAVVEHPVRRAPWGISIFEQKKSRFNALLFRKHPALFRSTIEQTPVFLYYGVALSLACVAAGCLSRHFLLAKTAAAVWICLTFFFVFTRLRSTSRHPWHVIEMIVSSVIIPVVAIYWRLAGAVKYKCWYW